MKSQTVGKKELSFYHRLLCACYEDVASAFPAQHQTEHIRDLETIEARLSKEGIGFLTKTLPTFVKAIDFALATGSTLQVPHFARRKGSKLPRFLGWLLERIFSNDGTELAEADPVALRYLRQLLFSFYKLKLPFEDATIQSTLDRFVETDSSIGHLDFRKEDPMVPILKLARRLIHKVVGNSNPLDIIPRHGPGSVATGEKPHQKPFFRDHYSDALDVYPLDSHFCFNLSHVADVSHDWSRLRIHRSSTAKVVLVPKDSRGPRLISMEPLAIQWLQQGQMDLLVKTIESHPLTRGQVNFLNQEVNRSLALHASLIASGSPGIPGMCSDNLVTLDMKDASDRVSLTLVRWLFPSQWIQCLEATRSSQTILPDGRTVVLNKFAPMGSAVCFPVEALVFWALSVASVLLSRPGSRIRNVAKAVWVYGDDIIMREKDYSHVITALEKLDLKFNISKCCTAGSFRESCGLDAYRGIVVTPTRYSSRWVSPLDSESLSSYVAYSNAMYEKGFYKTAHFLEKEVQLHHKIPYSREDCGGVCFIRPDQNVRKANTNHNVRIRFNRRYHRVEVFGPKLRPIDLRGEANGWEVLLYRAAQSASLRVVPPEESHRGTRVDAKSVPRILPDSLEVGYYPNPRRVCLSRGWTRAVL